MKIVQGIQQALRREMKKSSNLSDNKISPVFSEEVFTLLQRLEECQMTLDILSQTKIGRDVNRLKKTYPEVRVRDQAKLLITKWKRILAAADKEQQLQNRQQQHAPPPTQQKQTQPKKRRKKLPPTCKGGETKQAPPMPNQPIFDTAAWQMIHDEIKSTAPTNTFDLKDIISDPSDLFQAMRIAYEAYGVVIVTSAVDEAALSAARKTLFQTYLDQAGKYLSPEQLERAKQLGSIFEIYKDKELWRAAEPFGNISFGFFYHQREAVGDRYSAKLGPHKETVPFAPSGGYQACIELLCHSQQALAVLTAFTGNHFVSWDSVKVGSGKALTAPHVDVYSTSQSTVDLQRCQAMIIGQEEKVKLHFLKGSHKMLESLYNSQQLEDGFRRLPGDFASIKQFVANCSDHGLLCSAPAKAMVLWKSGVTHFEGVVDKTNDNVLYAKSCSKSSAERYVVGTHRPFQLSNQDLKEHAVFAHHGFFPHPYCVEPGTVAHTNSVHRKSTQFCANRKVFQGERTLFEKAVQNCRDQDAVDKYCKEHLKRPIERFCYGIDEPVAKVFSDSDAYRIATQFKK